MSIVYTYEVVAVDNAANSMEVVYSADGYETLHVGVRLPFEGEELATVIDLFAPIAFWESATAVYQSVAVGTTGTHGVVPELTLAEAKAAKAIEIAAARYAAENKMVSVSGVVYAADRASRAALNTAYTNLTNGVVESVSWKTVSGFVTLTATTIVPVVTTIAASVQASFDIEADLASQIAAAETVEQLNAIAWPA